MAYVPLREGLGYQTTRRVIEYVQVPPPGPDQPRRGCRNYVSDQRKRDEEVRNSWLPQISGVLMFGSIFLFSVNPIIATIVLISSVVVMMF